MCYLLIYLLSYLWNYSWCNNYYLGRQTHARDFGPIHFPKFSVRKKGSLK